ncbi:MAG: hypothetical protein LBP76_13045 [Treponema sp.]|jgi:hypothetical protein|nr:hypothetical protein [Treponema sp.]
MKRFFAFSIVFAILSGAVFAEITVTGGATATFIPLGIVDPKDDGKHDPETLLPVAGLGKTDGDRDSGIEMQVNVAGETEGGKAGFLFQWRPHYRGGDALSVNGIGDNAGLWVKPIDLLRIDVGRFTNNDIRGRVGSGAWFGDFTIPRGGEGDIFSNFGAKMGVMVSAKDIVEGLGVYVLVNNMLISSHTEKDEDNYIPASDSTTASLFRINGNLTWAAGRRAEYIYENTQAAVSYAIPNIGLARVQYIGAAPSATYRSGSDRFLPTSIWSISAPRFEAAFAYTGMEGLIVDVGGKFYLPFDDVSYPHESFLAPTSNIDWPGSGAKFGWGNSIEKNGKYQAPFMVALGASYNLSALTLYLRFDAKFGSSGEYKNSGITHKLELGPEIKGWLTANYKLSDTLSAQAEGGLIYAGESIASKTGASDIVRGSDALLYGFGAGVQATLAENCTIKVGATFTGGKGVEVSSDSSDAESVTLPFASSFTVPVIFSVSF